MATIKLISFFLFFSDCYMVSHGINFETQLINQLLNKTAYNKYARPARNDSEVLEVKFDLLLRQIVDVDEKNEVIVTNVWIDLLWTDYNLQWNPDENGGIRNVRLPSSSIWTPDVLMHDIVDHKDFDSFPTHVIVHSDGFCDWMTIGLFSSRCPVRVKWFPFDYQTCRMKFESWTHDVSKINLTNIKNSIDLKNYQVNGEWQIIDAPVTRDATKYDCCPHDFVAIVARITLRRVSPYYVGTIIIPVALYSILALITFILPPEAGERISLSITILLSLGVVQLIVSENIPPTSSEIPLIMKHSLSVTFMCTVSLVMTILVLNLHFRTPDMYDMPKWVRRFFCEWLAKLLRMSRPRQTQLQEHNKLHQTTEKLSHSMKVLSYTKDTEAMLPLNNDKDGEDSPIMAKADYMERMERYEMFLVLKELRYITQKMRNDDDVASEINDWRFVAMVIDRACFWIFSIYLIVVTTLIFNPLEDPDDFLQE